MTLRLADLDLTLLPEMAAWLPKHRALVVTDLHLGKSATFRARGIPIPEGETRADLARLEASGWRRVSLRAYDTLPQTPHVELIAKLAR